MYHVPDNVRAVINFLDISCTTKDHPMVVNVLHMVKLRGQVTPIFIAHQKKRNPSVTCSYSENVIISFNKYEANKWGAVTVNTFTAVSPPSLMQDDICTVALDELASLIILPFDRTWYIDGVLRIRRWKRQGFKFHGSWKSSLLVRNPDWPWQYDGSNSRYINTADVKYCNDLPGRRRRPRSLNSWQKDGTII